MHKLIRSTLIFTAVAAGLAACGDKHTTDITVCPAGTTGVPPNCSVGRVTSVSVAPTNVNLTVGVTQILAATVVADAGVSRTVTWRSASPSVATVSSTGLVTAVAPGTAIITAISSADTTKQGSATITVTAAVVAPTISIGSITTSAGAAANLASISGAINVTLLINPGTSTVNSVLLIQNCSANGADATKDVVVASQTISAPASQVTLSYNTAALGPNGQALFLNGTCYLKGRLTTTDGQTVNTAAATQITLNNANTFSAIITNAGTNTGFPASATNPVSGSVYYQGNVTATITAVTYTSSTPIAQITGSFLGRTFTATATAPGSGTFAVVFPNDSTKTTGFGVCTAACLGIYQYVSPTAGETGVVISAVTDASGGAITPPSGSIGGAGYHVDNRSPFQPTSAQVNTNGNSSFVGGSYNFVGGSGTSARYVSAGDSAFGPNTVIQIGYAFAGSVPPLPGTNTASATNPGAIGNAYCSTNGFTVVAPSASNIPTSTTTPYQARAFEYDLLGNVRCTDLTVAQAGANQNTLSFGVDRSPPLISFAPASVGANTGSAADAGKNFVLAISDTGSGFMANPVQVTIVRNFFGSATAADCVVGSFANGVCSPVAGDTTYSVDNNTNATGYYTITAFVRDRAGNASPTVSRTFAIDGANPTVGAITQSPGAISPLGTGVFSAPAADNLDLNMYNGNLFYTLPTGAIAIVEPSGSFGAIFAPPVKPTGTTALAVSSIFRGLQGTDANGQIAAGNVKPNIQITVTDELGNVSAPSSAPIAMTSSGVDVTGTGADSLLVTGVPSSISRSGGAATIAAEYHSPTAESPFQPFQQVNFYTTNASGQLVFIGSQTHAVITGDVNGRRVQTYTLPTPLTASAYSAGSTFKVYVVGFTSSGDAVVNSLQAPTVMVTP